MHEFSLPGLAAKAGKFQHPRPDLKASPMGTMDYAYQFDAALYAKLMRKVAEERGVKHTEGKIVTVKQNPTNEHIDNIELENGTIISGDLFIDCSGFKGL